MSEVTVTAGNFEQEVLQSELPVLIDFWASWCGPCRMLAPIVAEIAEEYADTVKVCKVNVDEEPQLAAAFRVSNIPMLAVMKDGKPVNAMVGYRPKDQIVGLLGL